MMMIIMLKKIFFKKMGVLFDIFSFGKISLKQSHTIRKKTNHTIIMILDFITKQTSSFALYFNELFSGIIIACESETFLDYEKKNFPETFHLPLKNSVKKKPEKKLFAID